MKHSLLLGGVLVLASVLTAKAQTGVTATVTREVRDGRVILSDPQATANATKSDTSLPREVRERLARFERSREAYQRAAEELKRKLQGAATEKDRDLIREQIRAAREAWLERLRGFREELKDRLPDLRRRMPELNEMLDNARNNARDAVNSVRKRRGQD